MSEKIIADYTRLADIEIEIERLEDRIFQLVKRHEEISEKGRSFLRMVLGEEGKYVEFCKEKGLNNEG